jgi:cytochrome c2
MKAILAILVAAAGCTSGSKNFEPATGGDPQNGVATIRAYGCAACHDIPGVAMPGGRVGPPLTGFAKRAFIGGELPNTPENLERWIRDPHEVEKHTAMPTLGLTQKEARDVAAYLYTLD